nr:TetR/AcrR family transcriptional regulator [Streptomyces violaceoruber]
MAFDCARAPEQGETGDDGIAVAVDAGGKGTETGQIVLPDGDEPVRKTFALALGQHDGEGADVSGERVGLGAVGAHGFEQQLFGPGKGFRSPVVDLRGVQHLSLREIAREAGISHGQLQHYFASRQALLTFAVDFAAEQTTQRIRRSLEQLGDPPHPRDVLRLTLMEMLPLHADARATSRMNAAYVLEALHDEEALARTHDAMTRDALRWRG